ncbi:MAG TPA: PAS domain-containing protein [Thermoleophilaceae bacterium]|nr:PAS domain-containing protein [Thermoleophilaceae bacterium]
MSAGGLVESAQASGLAGVSAPARVALAAGVPAAAPIRTEDAILAHAARAGADLVGDACVVWRVLEDGRLEPAATFHRDRRLRYALGAVLHQPPLRAGGLWPGQVATSGAPTRVRRSRLGELAVDTGIGMRRAHALLAPVLVDGRALAVIVALRDSGEPEYSLREEVVMRRVAAKVGARAAAPHGGRGHVGGDEDGGGDRGDGAAGDDGPPSGDGWMPPAAWLMDHIGVGIWVADRDGMTTYVNSAMTELLGVPAADVVGRPMSDFLEDVPQMVRGEYCMDAERCDRRLTQPDGRHVWLEMTSLPLVDDDGARRGVVSTTVDVTARKQVELAARQRVPRAHRRV